MYKTFLHKSPNSEVNWVSGSTGQFGGHISEEIKSGVFLLKELDCFPSIE